MSHKNRLLLLQNDNTLYQLLLSGLLIASPVLHFLCFNNSSDPLYLRLTDSVVCCIALIFSRYARPRYAVVGRYITILSFLLVNNFLLPAWNNFSPVYLFSVVAIFIALTLFCRKRWEFIMVWLLNAAAVLAAYAVAVAPAISVGVLMAWLLVFAFIAYASFLVRMAYDAKLKKAVSHVMELNRNLLINDNELRENRKSLDALMNSLNDVIFEFSEDKICLNTWFRKSGDRLVDPESFVGKNLETVLGAEKAEKYNDAIDYVIHTREQASFEISSDFNSGRWFFVRFSPVRDSSGNYVHRISVSVTDISAQKRYANALKESEALLTEAQVMAKTGNWWYDHSTDETFWSKNLYHILEIDAVAEDMDKRDFYISLVHPDDREQARRFFGRLEDAGESKLEHRLITPFGNLKYLILRKGSMIADEAGKSSRSVGVLQDVTEAKLAEKKIKVSRAELMEAQAIAKIGNWKWDVISNRLSWSDEINNIFEVDAEKTAGSNFVAMLVRYVHPDDRHILRRHLKDLSKIADSSCEYRIVTPGGRTKYLSVIVGKLLRRDDGTLKKVIGTLQDITDRKLAELEHHRTENKYRLILETIKLPAVSIDKNGIVIFCNKYAANMLGYEQHEILGLNWIEKFVPANLQASTAALLEHDSFKPENVNTVICRNGEQRIISWRNTVSYDENGNAREVTGIGEDVTERERKTEELISAKEQAERSSQFKSEFLSIMSHEIRTPMNAVIGTTNLLLSEDPKPEQMEYLNTLKFSGENLLAIINDILDYNKMEAGKLELNPLPFDIFHLVQRIKNAFYAKAAERAVGIELLIDQRLPSRLVGDQVRLGQILNNLVSNAIKFTSGGKVSISLDVQQLQDSHVDIRFVVADTGIGIAPENLGLIFEPFEQETQISGEHYGGTGLGLAITRRLVELHNSSISVSSELNRGTEFSFTISFQLAEADAGGEIISSALPGAAASAELRGMKILLVDDNKINLLIASKFLKKWQAEPFEAVSGPQAIEMAGKDNYDLIIMDLQMPGMDGFEASQIIGMQNPGIPIIALTADAMPETYTRAFAAGMCDYLTKPFVPQTLFEKVSKYYVPVEE